MWLLSILGTELNGRYSSGDSVRASKMVGNANLPCLLVGVQHTTSVDCFPTQTQATAVQYATPTKMMAQSLAHETISCIILWRGLTGGSILLIWSMCISFFDPLSTAVVKFAANQRLLRRLACAERRP